MSNRKVKVDDLASAIVEELESWVEDVTDGVKKDVQTVARETKDEIKNLSPVDKRKTSRKGRYRKGWSETVNYEDRYDIRVTVHNKTDYQLAHLLEFGHELVKNGKSIGRVEAQPHIRPAEEHAEEKLVNKVKVRVKG